MSTVLETIDLEKRFGGIFAARNVSLRIETGARHALIGPNGAGKTTILNLLSGNAAPTGGRILFEEKDITARPPHRRARLGVCRTFQINQLFASLTPLESLTLAVTERSGRGWDVWRRAGARPSTADEVNDLAERFRLADSMNERTATLAYGKQRLLEVALAVAGRPRVLLLDEPAAGIPEADRRELLETIFSLPPQVAVLLVEHDMDVVFGFASRISVLVNGGVLAEGSPSEIGSDPRVRAAYLGES